jgi:hypothetical protein
MATKQQELASGRDLETLHRLIRRGFTAADFTALEASIRSKTSSRSRRSGAPKIVNNLRQAVLAGLFYLRYNYKPCTISQAARDIRPAIDIQSARTITPTGPGYFGRKSDNALYEDMRNAVRNCNLEKVAQMIYALIWWKKHIDAHPELPKFPFCMGGGQPPQHFQVIPKNYSKLFKWIGALEAKLPPH